MFMRDDNWSWNESGNESRSWDLFQTCGSIFFQSSSNHLPGFFLILWQKTYDVFYEQTMCNVWLRKMKWRGYSSSQVEYDLAARNQSRLKIKRSFQKTRWTSIFVLEMPLEFEKKVNEALRGIKYEFILCIGTHKNSVSVQVLKRNVFFIQ